MSNDKKTITIYGQSDKVDSVMYSNDKQPSAEEILEIIQNNYNKFKGTNEAELHASVEIENLFNLKPKALQDELTQVKEQNKQLAEALEKYDNLHIVCTYCGMATNHPTII